MKVVQTAVGGAPAGIGEPIAAASRPRSRQMWKVPSASGGSVFSASQPKMPL
jgi:hypothetical protein